MVASRFVSSGILVAVVLASIWKDRNIKTATKVNQVMGKEKPSLELLCLRG